MKHNRLAIFGGVYYSFPKAWSPYAHGTYAYLSPATFNLQMVCTSQAFGLGAPLLAINPGDNKYFEGKVDSLVNGGEFGIGQIIAGYNMNFADSPSNWGYAVFLGTGYKSGGGPGLTAYGAGWGVGDILGAHCDYTQTGGTTMTLTFYKNGVSQGAAYTGLTGVFYPAAGTLLSNAVTITANFVGPITSGSLPAGATFF